MKTAFLTSVLGLGASGALTFFAIMSGKEGDGGEVGALKDVENKLQELVDETKTGFKVTNYNLEQALKQLSEGATAQIIQALESVITDFNNNLKEQFGENFKQLNEAVFKLLEWQRNYSTHVELSTSQLNEATKNIKRAVEATVEATSAIETISQSIDRLLLVARNIEESAEQSNAALIAQKKILSDFDSILLVFKSNLEMDLPQYRRHFRVMI
jgi:chromosome segregation ATPase